MDNSDSRKFDLKNSVKIKSEIDSLNKQTNKSNYNIFPFRSFLGKNSEGSVKKVPHSAKTGGVRDNKNNGSQPVLEMAAMFNNRNDSRNIKSSKQSSKSTFDGIFR